MPDQTMTRAALLAMIRNTLADILDNPSLQLSEETMAEQVEDWDSINHVKLLIAIENELSLRFATTEIEDLKNVGALIDLLEKKLKG